jgi:hypothetical protein
LATVVGPVQIFFSLTVHYFKSFIPIAQQAWQAAVLGHLPLSIVCPCFQPTEDHKTNAQLKPKIMPNVLVQCYMKYKQSTMRAISHKVLLKKKQKRLHILEQGAERA